MPALVRLVQWVAPPTFVALIITHLTLVFYPPAPLATARAALALIIILGGLVIQGSTLRAISLFFLAGGLAASWQAGFTVQTFLGLADMSAIVVLLLISPVAGFLFEYRPYGQNLLAATRRWLTSSLHLHGAAMLLTALLCAMVGMAGMVIVFPLLAGSMRDAEDTRAVSVSLLRGFASASMWAPAVPVVAMAVDMLGQPLYTLLPVGMALAALFMGVSLVMEGRLRHRPPLAVITPAAAPGIFQEFLLAIVAFIALLLLLERWTGVGTMTVVPLTNLLFTSTAFAILGGWNWLRERLRRYWRAELYRKAAEGTGILAAGFLLVTLQAAGLRNLMDTALAWLSQGSAAQTLIVLPLAVIVLGTIGVPAMVSSAMILSILQGHVLPVPGVLAASAVTLGVATISMAGPVVAPIFLLSSVTGQPTTLTGTRWNWRFSLVGFIVIEAVLQLLAWIFA